MQRRLTDFYPGTEGLPSAGRLTLLNMSASASSANTSSPKNSRKRKSISRAPMQQMILDAGQKIIGLQHCAKCGMVYNVDDRKDVDSHEAFHNRFAYTKFFRVTVTQLENWKMNLYCEYISAPVSGVLFRLNGASSATLRKRVEDIVKLVVNEEIGFCSDLPVWDMEQKRQAIVLIVTDAVTATNKNCKEAPFVGALVLIDAVRTATLMPNRKNFQGQFVGINRIWTHSLLRGRGIACALLDAVCRLAVRVGHAPLPRSRVAFIDPTEAGVRLAKHFVTGGHSGVEKDVNRATANERYIVHLPQDILERSCASSSAKNYNEHKRHELMMANRKKDVNDDENKENVIMIQKTENFNDDVKKKFFNSGLETEEEEEEEQLGYRQEINPIFDVSKKQGSLDEESEDELEL